MPRFSLRVSPPKTTPYRDPPGDALGVSMAAFVTYGNETQTLSKLLQRVLGQTITSVRFEDDTLTLGFINDIALHIQDVGQSCCESRYMTTDDRVEEYVGQYFFGFELKDATETTDGSGEEHEIQFLEINTSMTSLTIASHNEHNGYYGGFSLACREIQPQ